MEVFFTFTDLIGTMSYAIIAVSYLMTNIFWLRIAAVIGMFIENAYFRLSGGDLKVGIGWELIFIGINLFQLICLVREGANLRLPPKDALFLRGAFKGFNDSQIAKFLRASSWKDASPVRH